MASVSERPILVVSELFPPFVGGSAALLGEIYSRLAPVRVRVVTDRDRSAGPLPPGYAHLVVDHWKLATSRWGVLHPGGWAHHVRVAGALARLARREGAVLHCGRVLPEGLWAWVAHRLAGVPFMCWSHGEDATGARTSRELAWLATRIYNAADTVFANSRNTSRILHDLGVADSRVTVVHPGVDVARFAPGADGAFARRGLGLEDRFVLLTVARLQLRKGHDLVIRALAALAPSNPVLHYVIAGTGAERDRLEQLAAQLGVSERVTFVGHVSPDDLPGLYAACDVFVHPNRVEGSDIEGFGLVFLEAAAAGRPAIGGNSGGVPETLIDGETGVLVSGTDVSELARAIQGLAGDPARRRQMGMAARARVERDFTWERAARAVGAAQSRIQTTA